MIEPIYDIGHKRINKNKRQCGFELKIILLITVVSFLIAGI